MILYFYFILSFVFVFFYPAIINLNHKLLFVGNNQNFCWRSSQGHFKALRTTKYFTYFKNDPLLNLKHQKRIFFGKFFRFSRNEQELRNIHFFFEGSFFLIIILYYLYLFPFNFAINFSNLPKTKKKKNSNPN